MDLSGPDQIFGPGNHPVYTRFFNSRPEWMMTMVASCYRWKSNQPRIFIWVKIDIFPCFNNCRIISVTLWNHIYKPNNISFMSLAHWFSSVEPWFGNIFSWMFSNHISPVKIMPDLMKITKAMVCKWFEQISDVQSGNLPEAKNSFSA